MFICTYKSALLIFLFYCCFVQLFLHSRSLKNTNSLSTKTSNKLMHFFCSWNYFLFVVVADVADAFNFVRCIFLVHFLFSLLFCVWLGSLSEKIYIMLKGVTAYCCCCKQRNFLDTISHHRHYLSSCRKIKFETKKIFIV